MLCGNNNNIKLFQSAQVMVLNYEAENYTVLALWMSFELTQIGPDHSRRKAGFRDHLKSSRTETS